MDFIEKLLLSFRFDTILVIVNQLTKQVIFISAYDTIMSVYSPCVPSHGTSDRGLEFVSNFFCSLSIALNIQLHFTSGHHPKGDRQTKYMNQTLEQYLQIYCNYQQDN